MKKYLSLLALYSSLFSMPENGNVIGGDAVFHSASPDSLKVSASDNTIIDWNSFSIDPSERVEFLLPSSQAAIINRVLGSRPSEILGSLVSNGQVLLINPQGIVFGKDSSINTASFIASSFDLQTDLFLRNKKVSWIQSNDAGRIEHKGRIIANQIELNGSEIFVFKDSVCQASHPERGGEIFIGNREQTSLIWAEEGSRFLADALESGPGGKVILYSLGETYFNGYISAQGGPLGGEGGFAEVSGGYLSYLGLADLRAAQGKAGTLLLDPTNITITAAVDLLNTATGGISFPLTCGGVSQVSTRDATTAGFAASSISVIPTLTNQLAVGNVIIDSTTGPAATGNITWNAGANFNYVSAFDLILRAPATGTVTILSNVQNSGTGALIIDSLGPSVLINTAANAQSAAFGSLNGLTQVCVPNGDLTLQAGNTTTIDFAQLGFNAPTGSTANGPIRVTCRNLSLFGSTLTSGFAHIGHGQMNSAVNQTLNTTNSATIDIDASGNINLFASSFAAGAGGNAAAIIGHGHRSLINPSTIQGNITVNSGGNITLLSNPFPGNPAIFRSITARIGHGVNGTNAGTNFTAIADIFVEAAGNITMTYTSGGAFHDLSIGHFAALGTLQGDITVIAGGSVQMNGNPGGGAGFRAAIGHLSLIAPPVTVTGNTRVFACQDILLQTLNSDVFGIGSVNAFANSIIGDVEVAAGRDISILSNGTSNAGRIGNNYTGAATSTRTFVAAGRDVTVAGIRSGGIGGFGDIHVSAGRNVTVTSNSALATAFIGTDDSTNVVNPRTTFVFAAGNVIASNPFAGGRAVIGRGLTPAVSYTSSLTIRAGGDIQLATPFNTSGVGVMIPTSGNLFLEADTNLPSGALWAAGSGQITAICQVSPNLPILLSTVCPATNLANNAPAIPANALGGLRFDTGGNGGSFGLQTTVGSITLHSAQFQAAGASQDLVIGTGLNNANILTTSGDIEIWGSQTSSNCVRGDSFNNIDLDQALVTTGSVFISANNDFTMTPVSSIDTSGGNSPVTLIVDNQAPSAPFIGSGRFIMNGGSSVSTGTGLLEIYTALQNANTINGLLNGAPFSNGVLFVDTDQETWCTYFCTPLLPGFPFKVSYKNCLQQATVQAMIIIDQFLVSLHPYNEFPGWKQEFQIKYDRSNGSQLLPDKPYFLRRRHLNHLNQPKTYTVYQ